MDNGAYHEGEAANAIGLPTLANPYQNEIARLVKRGSGIDSKLYELASSWDSGWFWRGFWEVHKNDLD